MPKPPFDGALDALEMARAILGRSVRIIGASFRGNENVSGLGADGAAVLSTGGAGGGASRATSYIDIDFVAESDEIGLAINLTADEIPTGGVETLIRDGVSIWVNGRATPIRAAAPGSLSGPKQAHAISQAAPQSGVSFGFLARLGLARGQANSIRIATASLGLAAVFSTLSVTVAEAGNGKAVGNPGTGNNGNNDTVGNAGNENGQGAGSGGGGGGGTAGQMVANDDPVDTTINTSITVDLLANDIAPGQSVIFITEIDGQAVEVGDTITLSDGVTTVTLNEDGTVTIETSGEPGTVTFDYTAAYGTGNAAQSDGATVTIGTVPCFVAGTMIRTDRGDVPVERLRLGDKVLTRDEGFQPIRWMGQRTLPAEGRMAPVRIERGTFGDHRTLMVSPLHRVLVRNVHAELLFGSSEVLIAARDLIDGRAVRQIEGGQVHYVHFLFDAHQIVWSEGLETESFLPGPQTTHCFEQETVAEICEIFPELDPDTGDGYGPAARPALRRFEARLLAG